MSIESPNESKEVLLERHKVLYKEIKEIMDAMDADNVQDQERADMLVKKVQEMKRVGDTVRGMK